MIFKAYHKIRQFKDVVRDIKFKANYKGKDEEGNPIYEESLKPVLVFKATTKLHGTNAGVCYTPEGGIMAQKRSSFLPKDALASHFGFNQFVQVEKKEFFERFMSELHSKYCKPNQQITVYGEWAGTGVQKSVGISELPKAFYIFDCRVYDPQLDKSEWIDVYDFDVQREDKVHNLAHFPVWEMVINFNSPALSQNDLVKITEEIERECPVSRRLGIENYLGKRLTLENYKLGVNSNIEKEIEKILNKDGVEWIELSS